MEKNDKLMGWIRVLLLIIPYLIICGIFQIVAHALAGIPLEEEIQKTSLQSLLIALATLSGTLLILYLFMRFVDKRPFKELGLELHKRGPDIIMGSAMGLMVMSMGYFSLIILDEINLQNLNFAWIEILLSIGVFLAVSIGEEILFRGYIQRNLMYSFNNYTALFISSVIFALAHGFNPNLNWIALTGLFGAGILLGLSYIYTRNLWFPIALHFSWNLFQTYFEFNVSGRQFYSIIEFGIEQENIFNGGKFGFEASIFSLVFQAILILLIFKYFRKRKGSTIYQHN
jgi:membrane protease YdiL (CAAX protease family)